MLKQCLTSAAVLAMLTGVAMAQTTTIGTTTSTQSTTTNAPVDTYSVTKTQRNVDPLGTQVESSQTYKSGPGGSATRTETQVKRPDGTTESSYREQWSNAPGSVIAPVAPAAAVTAPVVIPGAVVAVPAPVVPNTIMTLNPDGSTTTTTRTTTTTIGR